MFLKKEDVKEKVRDIIWDKNDNDIVFIVASKGIGKIALLKEIYNVESSNRDIIIANGKRIRNSSPCLTKCFIDGICSYLEKHNSSKTREIFLSYIPKSKPSIAQRILSAFRPFTMRRKIQIDQISAFLEGLSLQQLKEIYVGIAGETPLIIFASAIWLGEDDKKYLMNLYNDTWGARVTFVVALRPTKESLSTIESIYEKNTSRVWVFPLLPEVKAVLDSSSPEAISPISVDDIGCSENYYDFNRALKENHDYFEMYDIVQSLIHEGIGPVNLCLMANQEMSNETYFNLREIISIIYPNSHEEYDKRLVLPYDGRLLWIDALAYYIAIYEGIDSAVKATQRFFFDVIVCARHFRQGYPTREKFIEFLRKNEKKSSNSLATGFSAYYASFATFAKIYSLDNDVGNREEKSLFSIGLLDRAVVEFTDENIDSSINLFGEIYGESQVCSFLDICIETIIRFFERDMDFAALRNTTILSISRFQSLCMSAAYQWLDLTLLSKLVKLQKSILKTGNSIKIDFPELRNSEKEVLFEYFKKEIERENLEMADVIVGPTIFLSYTHSDFEIADRIHNALRNLGYDVKRDIHDVEKWDNLQDFMKSIRRQDYAVFLVSDTYLRKVNCLYEIMQFMKDENIECRAFPIAIDFSQKEKNVRKGSGAPSSMFEDFYWIEIVKYWEKYAQDMDCMLEGIKRENVGELNIRYRMIKELAQTSSEFYSSFFSKKLLATIDPDNVNIENVVSCIDKKITSNAIKNKC